MSLLAQIAIFLGAAVIAIPIFRYFKLGSVLGYLAAGIIIGPAGRGLEGWTFRRGGKANTVRVEGRYILNGSDAAAAAALAGLGILSTGDLSVMSELESGQLVRVLPDWEMGSADINIVLPAGRAAKPSARAFADFMEAEFRQLQAAKNRGERIAS